MNRLLITGAALVAGALLMYSCSKKSNNPGGPTQGASIQGKWSISSYVERVTQPTGQVSVDSTLATHSDNVDFASNGYAYAQTWYDFTVTTNMDGSYSLSASTTDQDYAADTSTYKVSGSQLQLTQGGVVQTEVIATLTSNQLVIYTQTDPTDQSWVYLKR